MRRLLFASVLTLSLAAAAPAPPGRPRVFLIGLDAATWTLMDPLLKEGRLPNTAACIKAGARAPLATLPGYDSPALWTSIVTGVRPETHGILDFLKNQKLGVAFSSLDRRAAALWNIDSGAGRSVLAVEMLMTYPVEPVEGIMVSEEFPRGKTNATFPLEVADRLQAVQRSIGAGDARPFLGYDYDMSYASSTAVTEAALLGRLAYKLSTWVQSDELATRIAEALLPERRFDLFAIHLWGLDQVPHLFGRFSRRDPRPVPDGVRAKLGDVLDRYYEYTDRLVGRLLKTADGDTIVLIVSDHGMAPDLRVPERAGALAGALGGTPYWQHNRGEPGVLVACGPGIRRGAAIKDASLLDVTPTVLYLQGLPVAKDMTGRVLTELFEPARLKSEPVRWTPRYPLKPRPGGDAMRLSPEQMQSLRDLGYIK